MSDFLGEKDIVLKKTITSLERLSYGANTMRDLANISQEQCPRYTKENVVSGTQICTILRHSYCWENSVSIASYYSFIQSKFHIR